MQRRRQIPDEYAPVFLPIISRTHPATYVVVLVLLSIMAFGLWAWYTQLRQGLGVTGLNRPQYWGIYIVNFVFFIGISHAGTLISAILRVTRAEWRRPITRSAEAITVFALLIGPLNIILDLGRPDRLLNVFIFGRYQSPLLWDVISISTYFLGSILYLYLPLIPDLAMVRDRMDPRDWRHGIYEVLSMGWTGTELQKKRLGRAVSVMAVLIIPIAVSVHTVVSWVFSMTIQPMWHSTIFGPYFVVGAIYSGIATLLIAMAILRRVYHLEEFLTIKHFKYLAFLMLAMSVLWFYFTFAEYMTTFYGNEPTEMSVFNSKFMGEFAGWFWSMGLLDFVIPFVILVSPLGRRLSGIMIASVAVNVGMWIERYTIVVPTLSRPRLPIGTGFYTPSWVEISITAALFAGFALLYVIFAKLFPLVSPWELEEGKEREHAQEALHRAEVERSTV